MKKKAFALFLALALVVGGVVGGTVAWLTAKTDSVVNTFTVGDINIELTETWNTDKDGDGKLDSWTAKMVPGNTITKDPTVTVKAGSEACWLFVKVEESANLNDFITYEMAADWTPLPGVAGVYYCEVAATTTDTDYPVLKGNTVTVKTDVTKDMLTAEDFTNPTLTFTAYAIQKASFATAAAAWAEVSK